MAVEDPYVFDLKSKELQTGGDDEPCLPGGIGTILYKQMEKYAVKDLIAQIEIDTDFEDSFCNFLTRCKKLAIYLKDIGIKPGDIILACSPNNHNNAVILLGSLFMGAICASIDPVLSLEDITYLLKMVEPKVIFVSEGCTDLIQNVQTTTNINYRLVVLQKNDTFENLPQIFDKISSKELANFEPIFIKDTSTTACILFSSGTTGLPKGICISHDYLSSNILKNKYVIFEDTVKQDTFLCYTTLYWVSGLFATLSCCHNGLKLLRCSRFYGEKVWDIVDKYQVNMLLMSYYHCMEAFQYLNAHHNSITHFLIAGGQINNSKQLQYAEMLPSAEIINAYGMTEIGLVSVNNDYLNCSSGKPMHNGQRVKIVDPETEEALDLNKAGEIRVKHQFQMNGYYKKDSKDCWDADGFFKTGDIGYLNDAYELYIIDRIKEMFKFRSWHVIPAKIERYLAKHQAVEHCIVIGLPNEMDDNHAMAVIALKENCTANPEELLKYSNDAMDNIHQIRAGIRIVSKHAIPYTISGKINRRKLKAQILG